MEHFGILQLCLQVLGILALIEGGEEQTDWKVIFMNSEEAEEKMINPLDDLNNEYPDLLETIQKFFQVYKTPTGEPENSFAYNGEVQDKALALEVIRLTKFDKAAQYSIMCCQLHPQRVERNDQQLQHLWREVQHREHSARNRLYYQYGHSRGRGGQTGA